MKENERECIEKSMSAREHESIHFRYYIQDCWRIESTLSSPFDVWCIDSLVVLPSFKLADDAPSHALVCAAIVVFITVCCDGINIARASACIQRTSKSMATVEREGAPIFWCGASNCNVQTDGWTGVQVQTYLL